MTILKLTCPDDVGLLSRITGFVAERGGNLLEVHQYTDSISGWFFARLAVDTKTLAVDPATFKSEFAVLGDALRAEWSLRDGLRPMRTAILVSKLGHCLADLLWRRKEGELAIDIPLVISNHEALRPMAESEGIPFLYVPVSKEDKASAFEQVGRALREAQVELVVLARYMQIVPEDLCREFAHRIINIHHSFLPAFVGANPYRRAYERGVKLIGATCHYATADLDQGPIIDQEVVRVEQYQSPEDLVRLGRDCERLALARGVRYHTADRVLVHGQRSIVFRD